MLSFTFPKTTSSYWLSSSNLPTFDSLKNNMTTEIGIVGSGITGITLAYLLSKEGYSVTLIEAHTLVSGTTGNTTAKITTQHGLIYDELIQHYGVETAKLYYEANDRAKQFMIDTIEQYDIKDAKLRTASSIMYTTEGEHVKKLEKELQAYEQLSIDGSLSSDTELAFGAKEALHLPNQAHFHPVHYLRTLIEKCVEQGVSFFENTRAISVDYSKNPLIICEGGAHIVCQYVVQASHYPFFDGQQFFPLKMYADRSYALLAKTKKKVENMYINVDIPTRSIRPLSIENENYLIFAGENHRTGDSDVPTDEHFNLLAQFADEQFNIDKIEHMWSAQDYTTIDKIPYVGPVTKEKDNVLVATGYRKWGMTNGTNAALLLRDLIAQKETDFATVFSPQRNAKFDPSVKNLFTFNAEVAKHLVKGKFDSSKDKIEQIKDGEAAIIMHDGNRIGVYKDHHGKTYAVDTTCTHLGCEVAWNRAENSWDCPCHGSRFSIEGDVLNGPAVRNLKQINITNK